MNEQVARRRWVGARQRDPASMAVHAQGINPSLAADDGARRSALRRDGIDERRAASGRLRVKLAAIRRPVQRPAVAYALVIDRCVGEGRKKILREFSRLTRGGRLVHDQAAVAVFLPPPGG